MIGTLKPNNINPGYFTKEVLIFPIRSFRWGTHLIDPLFRQYVSESHLYQIVYISYILSFEQYVQFVQALSSELSICN